MLDDWEASIQLIQKTEVRIDATTPCKKRTKGPVWFQETEAKHDALNKVPKTKYACTVEAHEYTRQRLESSLPQCHEYHIADQGYNSMSHYN